MDLPFLISSFTPIVPTSCHCKETNIERHIETENLSINTECMGSVLGFIYLLFWLVLHTLWDLPYVYDCLLSFT